MVYRISGAWNEMKEETKNALAGVVSKLTYLSLKME